MHDLIRYTYHCYRLGCETPEIYSYSEKGLDVLIRVHEMEHVQETKRNMKLFDEALKKSEPKDYNKLFLNRVDFGFLKTRGITIDDDIELEFNGPKARTVINA